MEFRASTPLPVPAARALEWHARPGAFERLTPPWTDVEVVSREGGIAPGGKVRLSLMKGPLRIGWDLAHVEPVEPPGFADVQERGPFARWRHDHLFRDGPDGARLEDRIDFEPPLGALGRAVAGGIVRRDLERLFAYRHRVTREDLRALAELPDAPPRRILVSGASGLVGSTLAGVLSTAGHATGRIVRRDPGHRADVVRWDPRGGVPHPSRLDGWDAVVHLAGESIGGGWWTRARKRRIRESRVTGTRLLAEAIAGRPAPVRVLVCASAIGFWGSRGDVVLDEDSPAGDGFLAEVVRDWEAAAEVASAAGVRVVRLRFGLVLSGAGGLLPTMALPFRLGLGGRLGSGRQWMSWVSADDVAFAILRAIVDESLDGAYAVVGGASTNAEFTRTLGRVLGRPTPFPVPAPLLRLANREMAEETFLASQRVRPRRLLEAGFRFRDTDLEAALRHCLGRTGAS